MWELTWPVRETPLETAADEWRQREASHATRIHIRVLIWTRRQREGKIILREEDGVKRHNAGLTTLNTRHIHARTHAIFWAAPTSSLYTPPFTLTVLSFIKLSSIVADVKDSSRLSECSCYSVLWQRYEHIWEKNFLPSLLVSIINSYLIRNLVQRTCALCYFC
jgi:hypothetical protein